MTGCGTYDNRGKGRGEKYEVLSSSMLLISTNTAGSGRIAIDEYQLLLLHKSKGVER